MMQLCKIFNHTFGMNMWIICVSEDSRGPSQLQKSEKITQDLIIFYYGLLINNVQFYAKLDILSEI